MTLTYRSLLLSSVIAAGAIVGAAPSFAVSPTKGQDVTDRTIYIVPNGYIRYGEGLLTRVYSHTNAYLQVKGRGRCSDDACPITHNNIPLFARLSRIDLDRPAGTIVTERTLRRGDDGEDVRILQEKLIKKGYKMKADGSFGPDMEDAVRDFQRKNNLTVDGEIGAGTRDKLNI